MKLGAFLGEGMIRNPTILAHGLNSILQLLLFGNCRQPHLGFCSGLQANMSFCHLTCLQVWCSRTLRSSLPRVVA
ncbi:hypothetical protein PGB90_001276 [Kerria lacca]